MDFQHRVAAFLAVRVLAETEVPSLWGLPAAATLDWLQCEIEQPVDDVVVGTSASGCAFAQAKHSLDLSATPLSPLGAVLDQFVRQVLACRSSPQAGQPWGRALDPDRDRLVLAVGPNASSAVRSDLPAVLSRIRQLPRGSRGRGVAANAREARVLDVVTDHVRRSWRAAFGRLPSEGELLQFLSLVHVHVLDVDGGGTNEREAKHILGASILRDPGQVDAAWALLVSSCAGLASARSGTDRRGLQRILLDAGIEIRVVRSYRRDIERLKAHSGMALAAVAHLAQIRVGATTVRIARRSRDDISRAIEEGSLLVVGEAGTGKSGALHDVVQVLRQRGRDVVFLAVDQLAAQSLGQLREELGLEHELADVLANWPGGAPGFLVVDALDAARDDGAAGSVRALMCLVADAGGRWRVVASIRKFDLRYSSELRGMFVGEPPSEFRDPEFAGIRHVNVPQLSDEELAFVRAQSAALATVLDGAPGELRELLRVPFNLRLAGDLVGGGLPATALRPIRTQLELLDRYWRARVIGPDGTSGGDAREDVLRRACEAMVAARSLRTERRRVGGPQDEAPLRELLSREVLREWQPAPEAAAERYILAFGHHVLFDYAVARLLLRGESGALVQRLEADSELPVVIRPSLVLHFRHLWLQPDQEAFWALVLQLARSDRVREVGKLVGPSVAAEMARWLPELEPLCRALDDGDPELRNAAEAALRHVVGALLA